MSLIHFCALGCHISGRGDEESSFGESKGKILVKREGVIYKIFPYEFIGEYWSLTSKF